VQALRGQVEQPRADDAAAPPDLGDLGQVHLVAIELGMAQRRRLGVDGVLALADVGVPQDVETFGIRGHEPVLDAVVDHLDEVAGAVRAAVQETLLGRAGAPRGRVSRAASTPGASAAKIGVSRSTTSASPPIIRQ
jgi:hypothetical protein